MTTPKPCTMPEEVWIHKSGYWYPCAPKDRRSQPRTKYIRADLVEKMKDGEHAEG